MNKNKFRNKKMLEYALQVKGLIIFGLFLTLLSSLVELAGPYLISKMLDGELIENVGARDYRFYLILIVLYALSSLVLVGVRYIMTISFSKLSNQLATIIRKDVFMHVLQLPVQFFDKHPVGKIVNRITNDTQDIRLLFQIVFNDIITTIIFLVGILIGLYLVDPFLGLLSTISLPIVLLIYWDYIKKSNKYNSEMRSYRSDMNANINETIQNMEVIQAFNNEDYIYQNFSNLNDKVYKANRKLSLLWSYSSSTATKMISELVVAIVVVMFAYSHLSGGSFLTVGSLYIFIDYNKRLYQYLNNMSNRIEELEKAKSAADQVFEYLQQAQYIEGANTMSDLKGDIKFENVTFAYNENEYVLHDVSLDIPSGHSAAFVGHTGSGKSTIMNLIYGFYKINKGDIFIDGVPIEELDMVEIRKQMAIVFQNPYIFEGSIYENISLFDTSISKDEAEIALISVGGENILTKKHGINAHIKEGGKEFSSGERQLISFARAMVRNPKILVLDEATANVDSETEEYIQFGVNRLKRGRTTLIIAHRLSTIKEVDTIYVLNDGEIVERGSHDDLIDLNGIYADMYNKS